MTDLDLFIAGLKRGLSDGLNFEDLGHESPMMDEINKEWPLNKLMDLYEYACSVDINNLGAIARIYHSADLYRIALTSANRAINYHAINSLFVGHICDEDHMEREFYDMMIENGLLSELVNFKYIDYGDKIVKLFRNIKDIAHNRDSFVSLNQIIIPAAWKTQDTYNAIYENNAICDTTAVYLLRQFDNSMIYTGNILTNISWRTTLMLLKYGAIIPIDMFCDQVDEIVASNGSRICDWNGLFYLLLETYHFYHRIDNKCNMISEYIEYIIVKYPHLLKYICATECLDCDVMYLATLCPELISRLPRDKIESMFNAEFRKRCVLDTINGVQNRRISLFTIKILYGTCDKHKILRDILFDVYGSVAPKNYATIIRMWPQLIVGVNAEYLTNEFIYSIYELAPKVVRYLESSTRKQFIEYLGAMPK
jgi:hypothetical protein